MDNEKIIIHKIKINIPIKEEKLIDINIIENSINLINNNFKKKNGLIYNSNFPNLESEFYNKHLEYFNFNNSLL